MNAGKALINIPTHLRIRQSNVLVDLGHCRWELRLNLGVENIPSWLISLKHFSLDAS
jgi:hypothetical protein